MARILKMPARGAKVIQMPGPRVMQRYGLGDVTVADVTNTPWYSNPIVAMGALLLGGIYLGSLGHREAVSAGRRHRRRVRQAKSMFHAVDWGTVGAILAATAITGTTTYLLTKNANTNV